MASVRVAEPVTRACSDPQEGGRGGGGCQDCEQCPLAQAGSFRALATKATEPGGASVCRVVPPLVTDPWASLAGPLRSPCPPCRAQW